MKERKSKQQILTWNIASKQAPTLKILLFNKQGRIQITIQWLISYLSIFRKKKEEEEGEWSTAKNNN